MQPAEIEDHSARAGVRRRRPRRGRACSGGVDAPRHNRDRSLEAQSANGLGFCGGRGVQTVSAPQHGILEQPSLDAFQGGPLPERAAEQHAVNADDQGMPRARAKRADCR